MSKNQYNRPFKMTSEKGIDINDAAGKWLRKKSNSFYDTAKWKRLRYRVLSESDGRCLCCGASGKTKGVRLRVDHIKPRSKYPELEYDRDNLQVLCDDCNTGKLNIFEDDWR